MKLGESLAYSPSSLSDLDFICGMDEVGRGCGAGPVVTAAVILPRDFRSSILRDSKKLSDKQRNEAYKIIVNNAISIQCNAGSVSDINSLGINTTTFNTMRKCLSELSVKPEHILIDGTEWDEKENINNITLVPKGDDTYMCIAASAIVAKVRRDEYMCKLHNMFPEYKWDSNKGYLTKDHISGLIEFGATKYHRTQFIKNFIK